MIKAVAFDLDDTLFAERNYVYSAFGDVAKFIETRFSTANPYSRLVELFDIERTNVYQRLFDERGIDYLDSDVAECLAVFRAHVPTKLEPFSDAHEVLTALKADGIKLGLITDGRPDVQRAKLAATGLEHYFESVIFSDDLGGESARKPNPLLYLMLANDLKCTPNEMLAVGDNPVKDFAIAATLPIVTIRIVRPGILHANMPYFKGIKEDLLLFNLKTLPEAIKRINKIL